MTVRFVSIANFAAGHQWQLLCRFSDAGNDDLATRSGDRRPKSAKARNRGRYARSAVPLAQLWGFERRACRVSASARREVERLRRAKHAGGFARIGSGPEKRGLSDRMSDEQRICAS
jgi:hypothetical protein